MGFSSSVTAVIFFMAFLLIGAVLTGAYFDMQRSRDRAMDEREEMDRARENAHLSMTGLSLSDGNLTMSLHNDGDVAIDLSDMDILLDGSFRSPSSLSVGGDLAGFLYEGEVLDMVVDDAFLNATSAGGERTHTSTCSFTDPSRIASSAYNYVLDGTLVMCFDNSCDLLWTMETGLTDVRDLSANEDTVLVLGDGKVRAAPANGSSPFYDVAASGFADGTRMIAQERAEGDPYIMVLSSYGNITRIMWNGTGSRTISINGTNVNWTSPADICPGSDSFYLLDGDGDIFSIGLDGEDLKVGEVPLTAGEDVISCSSTGMDRSQVLVLIRGAARSRVQVIGGSDFELTSSVGRGASDLDGGAGLFILDGADRTLSRYTLGTSFRIVLASGHIHSEVL